MWFENLSLNTAKCWQTFHGFLQIYHSYYNKKLRVDLGGGGGGGGGIVSESTDKRDCAILPLEVVPKNLIFT